MGQEFAVEQVFNATPVLTTDIVTSGGISSFQAGLDFMFGARIQIASITKANPAVVTTAANHNYASGDVVLMQGLYQSSTTGMPQIAEIPFTITVTGATTFTIPWNTNQSNYTALSASPTGAFVKRISHPFLYAPGVSVISGITTGTTTTISTSEAHNLVVGQQVAFHVPTAWGTAELNELPNLIIPGSPIYAYVISVTNYNTFVINVDSSSYTAYNSNQPFNTVGQQVPQVVPVGDVNTGGAVISAGSPLYPPRFVRTIGNTTVNSIGGPGISGAFFTNTRMGFVIGAGAGTADTASVLVGASGNVIYWEAYLSDMLLSS